MLANPDDSSRYIQVVEGIQHHKYDDFLICSSNYSGKRNQQLQTQLIAV